MTRKPTFSVISPEDLSGTETESSESKQTATNTTDILDQGSFVEEERMLDDVVTMRIMDKIAESIIEMLRNPDSPTYFNQYDTQSETVKDMYMKIISDPMVAATLKELVEYCGQIYRRKNSGLVDLLWYAIFTETEKLNKSTTSCKINICRLLRKVCPQWNSVTLHTRYRFF